MSGRCRWSGTESHLQSHEPMPMNVTDNSLRMENSWHTSPTSQADSKFMCNHFQAPARSNGSPQLAVRKSAGGTMVVNCFTSHWMGTSCPCRFVLPQTEQLLNQA